MNVLKRIIIPKLEQTIRYILLELEELEREDTFRLKRVKQNNIKRSKQNGAGEQMEIINEVPKIEKEDTQPETKSVEPEPAEKPDKEDKESENADNKESTLVQPKEAAEMGDLIVIKPADDGSEVGDTNGLQTSLINMTTISEAKEPIDGITEMVDKESIKNVEGFVLEKREGQNKLEDDVINEDLEAGEWFETANKIVDDKLSEFSKMGNDEDAVGTKRLSNDTDSVPDLNKNGLASLYKGIDSNFYKPTIDDLFSKHDIAMRESISNDISLSSHSLVDLESIDFSIDSQGKVILSRHQTEKSSPALWYPEVDVTKQPATYDKAGMLIIPKSSNLNIKWQGESQAEDVLQSLQERNVKENDVDDNIESRKLTMDDTDLGSKMATGDVVKLSKDVQNTDKNDKEIQDLGEKIKFDDVDEYLMDDSTVNYEENMTNNTKNISENKPENKTDRKLVKEDKSLEKMAATTLSSVAHEKLSRISEEENVDVQEIIEVGKVVEHDPDKVNEIEQQIHTTVSIANIQENFRTITSARSSRDLHNNKDLQIISKESVLNPIAEENEVLKNVRQTKTLEHQLRDSANNVNKTKNEISEISDTTAQNLNNIFDAENKTLKIRDSTEITKVIDVTKQRTSQIDIEENNKERNIQIKRKSQVKQLENKLTINSSDEMMEPNEDNLRGNNQSTDKNKNQKEETEKEDEKETENNIKSDNEGSSNIDKSERHNGDDHLKQD